MASLMEEETRGEGDESPAMRPREPSSAPFARGPAAPPKQPPPQGFLSRLGHSVSRALLGFRSFLAGGRFSSLTRRIVAFNVAALFVLLSGILYLNQFREGLIDARRQSLLTQAEIIAGAVAQGATSSQGAQVIDPLALGTILAPPPEDLDSDLGLTVPIIPDNAAPILRRLVLPTRTRARLYDKEGLLILDSRQLSASGQVVAFELPPPEGSDEVGLLDSIADWALGMLPGRNLERFREAGSQNGTMYSEVVSALQGMADSRERVNDRGELIVSVAVPIQRYRAVLGVLMLSTRGGDIDRIVRAERFAILQVFLVALGVTILLSVVLAGTIAEPVRRLAQAAETVRRGKNARAQIPDFTSRRDEIGELSGALREMTNALYSRIDAIESFAADVAHEIKNPLTSLRSAIESFTITKDEKSKARLMEIIQEDVRRIDRLLSDISNASRLDAELSRTELEDVNIATLLETVCDLFNESGVVGSARVKLSIDPGAPGRDSMIVKGFDTRLGQVVRNLIDNALSFSPEGGTVYVSATRAPGRVIIRVEDEGPGIAPENVERIFDRFHTDRPDSFGEHSGLGLAISRQIVAAHGGTIRAGNRMKGGKVAGASFTVDLPAAA
ncbi:integral membrane sensor signal transduction histidine kinase [Parvibaculum lavamentivorans DS-1]|uniref:histidine kinase n=1 Tax=Parvibaculum lavamentivorans (strain DS-1 / DSM 13023 / NCIMB 13966) TaxID=402881 RepID=A7HPA2_PARL1|nr:sensor histidine kinase [Parvibaculum lavamentivorans]ABS61735.1 integral membrane sensor signal transduction histidine kinase [Parvibaculum lavamentivorans DS-1]